VLEQDLRQADDVVFHGLGEMVPGSRPKRKL
jgi:hypothetical protein